MNGPETIFGIKIATLTASGVAAFLSIILDWRNLDFATAIGVFLAGMFVAVVGTELTLDLLGVSEKAGTWGYAVAGAYGITGRNLILWLKQASANPPSLIREIFGFGKDKPKNGE